MSSIILNKREVALLKSAARRGDDDAQFQELLARLDKLVNDRTGHIHIPPDVLELIRRYGTDTGKLSAHGTLFSVFGRTLAEVFGRDAEMCTELIDINKKPAPVPDDASRRNWRTV